LRYSIFPEGGEPPFRAREDDCLARVLDLSTAALAP